MKRIISANWVLVVFIVFSVAQKGFAQNGVFQRIDTAQQQASIEFVQAHVFPPPVFDDKDDAMFDDIAATAGVSALASGDFGLASAISAASAKNLTPPNATTFAPTVDSALSILGLADGQGIAIADMRNMISSATGTFSLTLANPQGQASFRGALYLVAAGSTLEIESIEDSTLIDLEMGISSTITLGGVGTFTVGAGYDHSTQLWTINGNLPGGVIVNEVASGVNHFFDFTVVVPSGITVSFASTTGSPTSLAYTDADGSAQINYGLSASAWGFATPIGQDLNDGDFDADGDVDDDDFFLWLPNNGTDMGATLIEGDGDQDGDADLDDLILWLTSTTLPGIPGDFDGDNDVDGRDFLDWQRGFGILSGATAADGDANRDGIVDSEDLSIWQLTYGIAVDIPPLSNLVSVPEPSAIMLAWSLATILSLTRTHNKNSKGHSVEESK